MKICIMLALCAPRGEKRFKEVRGFIMNLKPNKAVPQSDAGPALGYLSSDTSVNADKRTNTGFRWMFNLNLITETSFGYKLTIYRNYKTSLVF